MTTTATGEGAPELGYNSNLYLASHLVRNAHPDNQTLALLVLLNAAHNQADGYLSSEMVRETIVQVIATGSTSVYTGIGKTEEQRQPDSFAASEAPGKTYDQAAMDAVLDKMLDVAALRRLAEELSETDTYDPKDWEPAATDEKEENDGN